MTPERSDKAREIFQAALGRRASERLAFLDAACGHDRELRVHVELLLAGDIRGSDDNENGTISSPAQLSSDAEAESLAGRVFAHYRLEREIGRGGMGRVYLAQDTRLKRPVALKLLPPSSAADAEWIRRFQQEALAVSALNHPNIITIHEIGESDGLRYIVTEFVDGETLAEIIARGHNDLRRVIRIILQVTEALTAAHEAGIVHRDIKPENIMVRADGYAKVLDFGLAKLSQEPQGVFAERGAHLVTTTPGMLLGTCKYMSPEQARGYRVDARTDIFSLGTVLYEAVTGQAAFQGETKADVLIAIAGEKPPGVLDYLPEAPAELQRIINKALKKNCEERYQTAAAMRRDLEELLALIGPSSLSRTAANPGIGRTRTAAFRISPVTELTRRRTKIGTLARWALPALALVLIAVAAYKWWHAMPPPAFDNIQVRRLTNLGQARFGAISPDGKFLGYAVRDESGGSFLLKQLATNTTRVVLSPTAPVELWWLAFSADSNYFYYSIEEVNNRVGGTLYRVPVLGGTPTKVIARLGWAGSFFVSPNDRQLLFAALLKPGADMVELTVVDTSGANQRVVKRVPVDGIGPVAWSPDSQSILLASEGHDDAGRFWQLKEIALADGSEKPLLAKYRTPLPRDIVWLPDHTGLILLALDEESGVSQVLQLSYPAGQLGRVTHDLHDYARLSMTADGKSLVTAQNDNETAIWIGPLAPPGTPAEASANFRAITSNVSNIGSVSATPEGKIVYSQGTSNVAEIWEMNADGSDARQLTANARRNSYPSVSHDGRYIVFTSNRSGREQIWRMDRDGSNPVQLTNENFYMAFPNCSPVSNWVVFAGRTSPASTSWGIWSVPLAGGLPIKLADSIVETTPAISPDGRLVVYEYLDQTVNRTKLAVQPLEGGPITTVANADVGFSNIRWTLDGKALAYVSNAEGRTNIWLQPLTGGPPSKLTDFKREWLRRFDWSRDGKQLICVRGRLTSDLFMISNGNSK